MKKSKIKNQKLHTLSTKSEFLNSKQILNSNFPNSKQKFETLGFRIWDLFRISDFGFRIFRFAIVILIFAFCILNSFGCAGLSEKDTLSKNEALLEPQALLKFSDIPMPVGFKLLTQDSYTFESAGIRVGMLKYQGKTNVEQVVNFYKDQMPLYNWNLLNAMEYGERLLNFEREQETCIIRLLPKGNNIIIAIALGPNSGARPKKADKPVK